MKEEVREFLELRQELSKTSVKKYDSMKNCACTDHRVREYSKYMVQIGLDAGQVGLFRFKIFLEIILKISSLQGS